MICLIFYLRQLSNENLAGNAVTALDLDSSNNCISIVLVYKQVRTMKKIHIKEYVNEIKTTTELIKEFWLEHNSESITNEDAMADLSLWTQEGNKLYLVIYEESIVGFIHLGSRGASIDWLENIFILSKYQNKGIGTKSIELVEEIVRQYSPSLYIEASARNQRAIGLYRKLGYDCLNTITVRKDFNIEDFEVVNNIIISANEFDIRKPKK